MATCWSHLSHEWWKLSHTVKLTSVRYYLINLIVFNLPKLTISSNKQKRTHYSSLTLDIIGKTAFDHDFHALDSIEKWATLDNRKNDQILNLGNRKQIQAFDFRLPPLRLFFGILGLGKFDFITKRSNAKLDKVVDEIIDNAKAKVAQQKICEKNSEEPEVTSFSGSTVRSKYAQAVSLLEVLLQAEYNNKDSPVKSNRNYLSKQELREEMRGFILAGHETTSIWIYWCSYMLCKYPDVQQKVYENILTHAPSPSVAIKLQMTNEMSYLRAFMKEVLRLYPPVGLTFRHTIQEETFDGIKIPANTKIAIPVHLIHRDPKYWSRPEDFIPERWLKDDFPANNKHAFLPFSTGPRNCIGYQFATMEAQLILATLIRKFQFELAPSLRDTKFTLSSFITTRTKPLVKICVRSRE